MRQSIWTNCKNERCGIRINVKTAEAHEGLCSKCYDRAIMKKYSYRVTGVRNARRP